MKNQRRNRCIGWHSDLMQSIGWAGTNTREAPDTPLFKHHDGALGMFAAWRVELEGEKGLKGTVHDAQVTARAVIFHNRHHGLTHDTGSLWVAIMLCLKKLRPSPNGVVKFIGSPHQPRHGGDMNG